MLLHLNNIHSTMIFGKNSYELELTLFSWPHGDRESIIYLHFVNCTWICKPCDDTFVPEKNPQSSDLIIWLVWERDRSCEMISAHCWMHRMFELGGERGLSKQVDIPQEVTESSRYVTRVERRKVAVWRNFISVVGKDFSEADIFKKAILKI